MTGFRKRGILKLFNMELLFLRSSAGLRLLGKNWRVRLLLQRPDPVTGYHTRLWHKCMLLSQSNPFSSIPKSITWRHNPASGKRSPQSQPNIPCAFLMTVTFMLLHTDLSPARWNYLPDDCKGCSAVGLSHSTATALIRM